MTVSDQNFPKGQKPNKTLLTKSLAFPLPSEKRQPCYNLKFSKKNS